MTSYLYPGHFDLVTPDGVLRKIERISPDMAEAELFIENISPAFVGYHLDNSTVFFNFKSVLAQLGLNGEGKELHLDRKAGVAEVKVQIHAIGPLAREMLSLLEPGIFLGKLFAADERRRVRNPDYLFRMFGRTDREGRPLLSLGEKESDPSLILEKVQGHMVAFLALKHGRIDYLPTVESFLPTLAKALKGSFRLRELLALHQQWIPNASQIVSEENILLVRTEPLHIRTVFARVVDTLLPKGYRHTSANILQPNTEASGDIYELFGSSQKPVERIPLEFYTLEPHREHVFFADRDQLLLSLQDKKTIFHTFETAPAP
ncbi:MAG: hypothetical protein K940chlam2_01313 [Chlamydiae bacterium]|nr:hypothetical protein [Chlamydiota bacterium]